MTTSLATMKNGPLIYPRLCFSTLWYVSVAPAIFLVQRYVSLCKVVCSVLLCILLPSSGMDSSTPGVQSPPFGYLSPPIDVNDASSDDGDHLQTPLTEHDGHHPDSYAVLHHSEHQFSHSFFTPDVQQRSDIFADDAPVSSPGKGQRPFASFSSILSPSPTEKASHSHPVGGPFASPISPPHALDLANASLEFNPFSSSFSSQFHSTQPSTQGTAIYTPTKTTFDFSLDAFESPAPTQACGSVVELSPLPSLSVSADSLNEGAAASDSLLLGPAEQSDLFALDTDNLYIEQGRMYSPRFTSDHALNPYFVRTYELGDELGAGGYGFVMTARHRAEDFEVAVKFIIKDKVPDHAWWDDDVLGRVPTEVMVMSLINHENIVKCLDLFEDDLYFYLVGRPVHDLVTRSHVCLGSRVARHAMDIEEEKEG